MHNCSEMCTRRTGKALLLLEADAICEGPFEAKERESLDSVPSCCWEGYENGAPTLLLLFKVGYISARRGNVAARDGV